LAELSESVISRTGFDEWNPADAPEPISQVTLPVVPGEKCQCNNICAQWGKQICRLGQQRRTGTKMNKSTNLSTVTCGINFQFINDHSCHVIKALCQDNMVKTP
jgi:hypothetical protein